MTAYYNEHDPYAAEWLRNLIAAGHIAPGVVDERDIRDVRPSELVGYTQCHFFAGIGGWSLALRLAGWPDDRPVWTGSCPCQPFSQGGRGGGFADERHLWPAWHWIINECRPSVVFGEQVASADGLAWLDLVCADMEDAGYSIGVADLCAAGVEAPHARQRLCFVAHAARGGREMALQHDSRCGATASVRQTGAARMHRDAVPLAHADGTGRLALPSAGLHHDEPHTEPREPLGGPWRGADWVYCRDKKWRAVEPGALALAYGVPDRVGKLRAYGNAIVPQVFAEFIASYREAVGEDGVVTLRQMIG